MKHLEHFEAFLRDVVNLNVTRIRTLEQRVGVLEDFLANSTFEPRITRFNPQGSWAHQTIIKPPDGRDFDADLLAIVEPVAGWEAPEYIEALYRVFRGSEIYKEIVIRKTRCVRIDYASDFHVDLIPIIEEIGHNGIRFFNCNRRDEIFEETAPEEYTDWWNERNEIVGNDQLQEVTRLLKYLRDIKRTFSCKSILLTTLVGYQVDENDNLRPEQFCDTPTSLRTIVSRLDDTLQPHVVMPTVLNPKLRSENYNRHWEQQKYNNFRSKIHQYREWIDDAFQEADPDESILKWRRVFGDDFAKSIVVKTTSAQLAPLYKFTEQWIGRIKQQGRQVLSEFPRNLEHVVPSRWKLNPRMAITLNAQLLPSKTGLVEKNLSSGDIVPVSKWLRFAAHCPTGIPNTYSVWWRVTNTGGHAAQKAGLRGDFYKSEPAGIRFEQTEYRGIHWVEAFVINNRNRECVGTSDPFFVVIE